MTFIYPEALCLLILVPLYILFHFYFERKKKKDIIPFGNLGILTESISKSKKIDLFKHTPLILKSLVLSLLILAISRPMSTIYVPMRDTKILLLMDISISMEASDIEPDRITAAKDAAKKFILDLPKGIQLGLGLFSGNVKMLVNPSLDKLQALNILDKLSVRKLEPGTAIGDAILGGIEVLSLDNSLNRKSKNNFDKIVILITDGEANVGADPVFAAAQAKVNNITIHSIGIGNPLGTIIRGGILTRLDEFTLREITSITGGYYFNAQNFQDMNKIYKKIKKTIKLVPQKTEVTFIPVICAFIILGIYQALRWSKFRFV
jgi:Ca-activated chloride channel family protein